MDEVTINRIENENVTTASIYQTVRKELSKLGRYLYGLRTIGHFYPLGRSFCPILWGCFFFHHSFGGSYFVDCTYLVSIET
ncbi:MAG TPA: hypothetical protein DCM71_18595 [Runella sp.]|nr:hypothetical protein [Runella sp.]